MCDEVMVGGNDASTCGELAAALGCGIADLVRDPDAPDGDLLPNECLCHVDIEATAQQHGLQALDYGWGFVLEPPTT